MLQTAWESDQIETVASEKSWNLQGWLSVGSHKLVQQTLRALVRRCSHSYAVRGIYIFSMEADRVRRETLNALQQNKARLGFTTYGAL